MRELTALAKRWRRRQIQTAVQELGFQCLSIDPAASGPIGKLLRDRIVDPEFVHNPELDTVLFAGLRAEGAQHILQAIKKHPSVILVLERWSLALAAYGVVDSTSSQLIQELRRVLDALLPIDITLVFDLGGEIAYKRIGSVGKKNRFELRGAEYLSSVARAYREFGEREARTSIIDASASQEEVGEQIQTVLASHIPEFRELRLNVTNGEDHSQLDLDL